MNRIRPEETKEGDVATACHKCGCSRIWKKHGIKKLKNGTLNQGWWQFCQSCVTKAAYISHTRSEHLKEARKINKNYRANDLLFWAKERASKKGIPFTITKPFILKILMEGKCEVTGLPFIFNRSTRSTRSPFVPTLDRKIPSLGYTPENTQVVCWLYNRAKGDGTHEDVMTLVKALLRATPT